MILKSFLVEKNLSLIENYNLVLISGENIGLKDELKSEIKKRFSNTEQISFDQEEIIKKPDLLDDQLNNKSLFNSKKVIFISEISEKIKKKIGADLSVQKQDVSEIDSQQKIIEEPKKESVKQDSKKEQKK